MKIKSISNKNERGDGLLEVVLLFGVLALVIVIAICAVAGGQAEWGINNAEGCGSTWIWQIQFEYADINVGV